MEFSSQILHMEQYFTGYNSTNVQEKITDDIVFKTFKNKDAKSSIKDVWHRIRWSNQQNPQKKNIKS